MCLVVWGLSPQGQAGDAITPHRYRDSAHLAWPHRRRFRVTNWLLGTVNPGCGHVGFVTTSCPGGTSSIHDCSHVYCYVWFRLASRAASATKGWRDLRRDLGGSRRISLMGTRSVSCGAFLYSCRVAQSRRICGARCC